MHGTTPSNSRPAPEKARKTVAFGALVLGVVLLGVVMTLKSPRHSPQPLPPTSTLPVAEPRASSPEVLAAPRHGFAPAAALPAPRAPVANLRPRVRSARELMAELTELS